MGIKDVTARFGELRYMRPRQAKFLSGVIGEHGLRDLLELGTFHGKGTAYMAAILEDLGRGHLTTLDRTACLTLEPNVHEVLGALGLAHRVTVRPHHRSFTMTLMEMLEAPEPPRFDFCYLDGAHTWDGTGFTFLLVDMLLKPGGWIVLDDLDWTLEGAIRAKPSRERTYQQHDAAERAIPQVRKVFEILVARRGYVNRAEPGFGWGLAQKPPEAPGAAAPPIPS